jgi:hypothetical protein
MKGFKLTLILLAAFVVAIGFIGTADAFHGGGVAHCDGCHSMHNSADNPVSGTPNGTLLKGSDASSTCLNCHNGGGGYHVADAAGLTNVGQGGDFGWILNPYDINVRGTDYTYGGDQAGHNIVALDFGYAADATNSVAPGGTYSASLLGCTSCHDAHGQVMDGTKGGMGPISVSGSYGAADPTDGSIHGNFRLLGDSKYEAGNHTSDGHDFTANAPVATSKNSYSSSYGMQTDYGQGMSEWCANCHSYIEAAKHVAGSSALMNGQATIYNSYVATGDYNGAQATALDELVPFERNVADGNLLDPASTVGPNSASSVMCLSCHRAHASGNNNAGRWDLEVDELSGTHALTGIANGDLPATAAVYYGAGSVIDVVATYGHYQRSLCNKCHVQD